ncbi:response regulator transcription factor [Gillisia limnaea]|uniref:Two component transcriptional regulator, LuxR family n=1 Tax=Gillisia limnaea (strain DSM 15749 / LMG 21470 / R-8282) TaxID=865937 RepID=H2BZY2_GILLR|nr:response regulator transcription factor [Gillisia limnaea]EHQ01324.1 two component transcriptional regulator, LuxR family [Gillisia limnaea DSM 15749]
MNKTIAIVDDHNLFAQSLKGLVNSFQEYEVLSVFKNGQELIDYFLANKKHPDIVLLDIRMPVLNGIETMEWLKDKYPSQKVLALTMEHEEEIIIKMIKTGCRGYLLKDIEPDEFFFALNCVSNSGYYLNEDFSEALKCPKEQKTFKNFSQREIEFINLACSERTYKQVADEMNLSPKTIDGYREALFQKLELKSRVGLVLFAVKNKMVSF